MCDCKECREKIEGLREDISWLEEKVAVLEDIVEVEKYEKTYIKK